MTTTKDEFIQTRAGIHQAQRTLEAAYSTMKRTLQWEKITGIDAVQSPTILRGKILQARRRMRREYQRACRAYEEKTSRKRSNEKCLPQA